MCQGVINDEWRLNFIFVHLKYKWKWEGSHPGWSGEILGTQNEQPAPEECLLKGNQESLHLFYQCWLLGWWISQFGLLGLCSIWSYHANTVPAVSSEPSASASSFELTLPTRGWQHYSHLGSPGDRTALRSTDKWIMRTFITAVDSF